MSSSLRSVGRQMGTPPIASTMSRSPTKSTSTSPSSRTPVRSSTVFHVHPDADSTSWPSAHPIANASLNCRYVRAGVVAAVRHRARRPVGHQVPGDRHQLDPGPVGGHVRDDRGVGGHPLVLAADRGVLAAAVVGPDDQQVHRRARPRVPGRRLRRLRPCALVAHEAGQVDLRDVRLELPVHGGRSGDGEDEDAHGREADRTKGPSWWHCARVLAHPSDASAQVSAAAGGRRGGPVRVCG